MHEILKALQEIYNKLIEISETNGTKHRVEQYKADILKLGWNDTQYKYHPDNNLDDPARKEVYAMVKFIYESMLNRGEI